VSIVPSYVAKVARAKKHLIDLQAAIDLFAGSHPYTVRERIEGKKKRKVWRLTFTADPANTDIPLIAADAIYNLRSSLDHLMSSLVPRNQRSSAMFPVYFEGVWEPFRPGENEQRRKDRARWASDTKALSEPALAILKNLQPADGGGEEDGIDLLRLLYRLSNRDKHEKLPVVAAGLREPFVTYALPDGSVHRKMGSREHPAFENHADIRNLPDGAMDVQIDGAAVVAIRVSEPEGHLPLPQFLWDTLERVESEAISSLLPFVRSSV
jgi:hypothetical protein